MVLVKVEIVYSGTIKNILIDSGLLKPTSFKIF